MTDWKSWVLSKLTQTVGFYFESVPALDKSDDGLRGYPTKPPATPGQIRARRMWPFGLRSIIPSGVEAFDTIIDGTFCAEDDDGSLVLSFPQFIHQCQPVHFGEHDIDHCGIIGLCERLMQA